MDRVKTDLWAALTALWQLLGTDAEAPRFEFDLDEDEILADLAWGRD